MNLRPLQTSLYYMEKLLDIRYATVIYNDIYSDIIM